MRICFVTANLGSGGAERVISLLANKFYQEGNEVEIVFFKEKNVFYKINNNIKFILLEEMSASNSILKKMFLFRQYINNNNIDVVIPFRVSLYVVTILSLLGIKVPIIASERIDPHIPDGMWTIMRKVVLPFCSHLVVQTNYIKSYYPKFIQKKISVILNPVRDISTSAETVKKQNRIISIARLDPQKNQQMMIRAFALLSDKYPDWQLVIYGEGSLRNELKALVYNLELDRRVLLPGRTNSVIDELKQSKIFCFSSNFEGLSNSLIEAICVGLPVVTTRVSGTEDIIKDGTNGFLITPGDISGMASSLEKLMSDDSLCAYMGNENKRMVSIFSIDTIFCQWNKLVKSYVKR